MNFVQINNESYVNIDWVVHVTFTKTETEIAVVATRDGTNYHIESPELIEALRAQIMGN